MNNTVNIEPKTKPSMLEENLLSNSMLNLFVNQAAVFVHYREKLVERQSWAKRHNSSYAQFKLQRLVVEAQKEMAMHERWQKEIESGLGENKRNCQNLERALQSSVNKRLELAEELDKMFAPMELPTKLN